MAFFEDLSRKVQDVAFAAAEKGKEFAAISGMERIFALPMMMESHCT